MNSTKRGLIIASAVFCFLDALVGIIGIILACTQIETFTKLLIEGGAAISQQEVQMMYSFVLTVSIIALVLGLASGSFLMVSVREKGIHFEQKKWTFWVGFVLTVLVGPFSLPAILLYISLSYNNYAVSEFKEERQDTVYKDADGTVFEETPAGNFSSSKGKEDGLKYKIDQLRELRDNGEITEEEFKKMLMKLF